MSKQTQFKPMLLGLLIALGICTYVPHRAYAKHRPTEYDRDGGYVFLTAAEYDVALVSSANPAVSTDVFAVSNLGSSTRPVVKWTSTTAVNINTVPTNGPTNL